MNMGTVLRTEFLKLRRTKILWVLAGAYLVAPFMVALMMAALKDPALGKAMGLLTTKAQLTIGGVDWSTYLVLVGYIHAGGIIVMGIVCAFLFGNEYQEGTAKVMLALPTHRALLVGAKLVIAALWLLAVEVLVTLCALGLGFMIDLPGFSGPLVTERLGTLAAVTLDVIMLSTVPAWLAVATRGVFAPMGLSVVFMLVGNFTTHISWGVWVPWAVILMVAGSGAAGMAQPGPWSQVVMVLCAALGFIGTWLSLDRSDCNG